MEVFLLLGNGETITSISKKLRLDIRTVSTYRCRIVEKLYAEQNADFAHYCLHFGLIDNKYKDFPCAITK